MASESSDTPMMLQWRAAKERHPDALLAMRIGDFWEFMYEDAQEVSRILGIALTARNNGSAAAVPLAGIPLKAGADYLPRLVEAGRKVAICDQVEDPAEAKGVVRREVVEVLTPGAIMDEGLLSERRNNFLAAAVVDEEDAALAAVDISTGEVLLTATRAERVLDEIERIEAAEVLLPRGRVGDWGLDVLGGVTERPEWVFDLDIATQEVLRRYRVSTLTALDLQTADTLLVRALGALLSYVGELQPTTNLPLRAPTTERSSAIMALDEMTRRNLEIVEPLRRGERGVEPTLLSVLDATVSAMGGRRLRRWLLRPLLDRARIEDRLDAVGDLIGQPDALEDLRAALSQVRDLERLAGRLGAGRAGPREMRRLADSLTVLPAVERSCRPLEASLTRQVVSGLDSMEDVARDLTSALVERPPATLAEGGYIADGFDKELDEVRALRDGGRDFIAALQEREREATGIASLKVGYNKVFGYYIEVTRSNLERVPEHYERKQTLKNAERYITSELKEWEARILGAQERAGRIEQELFLSLREAARAHVSRLQASADAVGVLDVFQSLARTAIRRGYCRPEIQGGNEIDIENGRHPVVETMMPSEEFIPNDTCLDGETRRLMILTGPNMAGKSTLLRQVGLIQLMAQVGSYVPASSARMGVADRIFTRVGAADNLVRGQSTFLVEMIEAAQILNAASERSLVLLDEIGRGTSTFDGLSLAHAISEHLHDRTGARTIFATHYHELTALADRLAGAVNVNVAIHEADSEIVFLRKLRPGGADRSYGIQVGRLAGLPSDVVGRAREILAELEGTHSQHGVGLGRRGARRPSSTPPPDQLSFFGAAESPVVRKLKDLDLDTMTPIAALNCLVELKREAEE